MNTDHEQLQMFARGIRWWIGLLKKTPLYAALLLIQLSEPFQIGKNASSSACIGRAVKTWVKTMEFCIHKSKGERLTKL